MVFNEIINNLSKILHNDYFAGYDSLTKENRHLRLSAVVILLVDRGLESTILLTKRTDHLYHHPGQISFPGGGMEDGDKGDPVRCALRECEEEIGLSADNIHIIGSLAPWQTGTGFLIFPVVGWVRPPFDLTPDSFEVEEILEIPLEWVLNPQKHQRIKRTVNGKAYDFWSITWKSHNIWGATAGLLVTLSQMINRDGKFINEEK